MASGHGYVMVSEISVEDMDLNPTSSRTLLLLGLAEERVAGRV
jgi:hypothetical protein